MVKTDAGIAVTTAIIDSAKRDGISLEAVSNNWTRWTSRTFTGARHTIVLDGLQSLKLDKWLVELPESEISIVDHLIVDIVINSVSRTNGRVIIKLEILTVE